MMLPDHTGAMFRPTRGPGSGRTMRDRSSVPVS